MRGVAAARMVLLLAAVSVGTVSPPAAPDAPDAAASATAGGCVVSSMGVGLLKVGKGADATVVFSRGSNSNTKSTK